MFYIVLMALTNRYSLKATLEFVNNRSYFFTLNIFSFETFWRINSNNNPNFQHVQSAEAYILWCLWWVGLGVLSSVGLGTGLHTFLLYLGPHIAAVTMAAYECGSTDFPSPPYPESILCPEVNPETKAATKAAITIWAIMSKVRIEAFCWGAGTALGNFWKLIFLVYVIIWTFGKLPSPCHVWSTWFIQKCFLQKFLNLPMSAFIC